MSIPIFPIEKENNIFHKNVMSIQATKVKTKIKTGYKKIPSILTLKSI